MYTDSGKNHVNQVLAGNAQALATHIYFGIDGFSTVDDAEPYLLDRHYSPFISVMLPIISRTVVDKYIIFATSHDTSKVDEFLGNCMALVYENGSTGQKTRIRKNLYNDFGPAGWQNVVEQTDLNVPAAWFNREGGAIVAANSTITLEGTLGLAGYRAEDIISIPMFWYGGSMAGGSVRMTFYYTDGGVQKTYALENDLVSGDAGLHYKFNNTVPSLNEYGVYTSLDLSTPEPHVFRALLGSGNASLPDPEPDRLSFLANLANIWKVGVNWMVTDPACTMYMGSPQITPDFDADDSGVTISWSPLNKTLINAGTDSMSAEYRLIGVT